MADEKFQLSLSDRRFTIGRVSIYQPKDKTTGALKEFTVFINYITFGNKTGFASITLAKLKENPLFATKTNEEIITYLERKSIRLSTSLLD